MSCPKTRTIYCPSDPDGWSLRKRFKVNEDHIRALQEAYDSLAAENEALRLRLARHLAEDSLDVLAEM